MSRSLSDTAASFSRCLTTVGFTKNRAAISSSLSPFSRRVWKARNWSSGCRATRWTFSASESSSPRPPSRTQHGTDAQALQQRAPGDVLGQLLDGDAGLHPAHIGLAEHQLVEGDVARGAEGDLLNGGCHVDILRDGRPKASLSTSNPSWNRRFPLPLGPRRRRAA